MLEFIPGEQKTAKIPMTNPTEKAFDYSVQLYMGIELAVMSEATFHLEAGESKDIELLVVMPVEPGTYPVNIGVFSNAQFIEPVFRAEDIIIVAVLEVYTCPYCLATFNTATELMDHIRTVHGLPVPSPTPDTAAFYLWGLLAEGIMIGYRSPVYIRIINYGGIAGDYNITAVIDGQTSTATGSLTPGLNSWAEFWFTPTRTGTHQITANGFSGSFEVVAPQATITLISLSMPNSAPPGAIQGTLTYEVSAGQIDWATLYVWDYSGQKAIPLPIFEGTHTVSIDSWQPSDGYLYHRIELLGQYYYMWTDTFLHTEVLVYLEE